MTYVVIVILIALWAIVLVPPYLKDRRGSDRTFRSSGGGALPAIAPAVRTSRSASAARVASAVSGGLSGPAVRPMSSMGSTPVGSGPLRGVPAISAMSNVASSRQAGAVSATGPTTGPSNVVRLHAVDSFDDQQVFGEPFGDEAQLAQAWAPARGGVVGMPTSTAAARERRRHVLIALTAAAFVTLLLAITLAGLWVPLNVAIDAALVGYVILLVRHRQIATERRAKVEPIRPPVTEQAPVMLQPAPAYLVRASS